MYRAQQVVNYTFGSPGDWSEFMVLFKDRPPQLQQSLANKSTTKKLFTNNEVKTHNSPLLTQWNRKRGAPHVRQQPSSVCKYYVNMPWNMGACVQTCVCIMKPNKYPWHYVWVLFRNQSTILFETLAPMVRKAIEIHQWLGIDWGGRRLRQTPVNGKLFWARWVWCTLLIEIRAWMC